jgi:6-phosphogluconolactonase
VRSFESSDALFDALTMHISDVATKAIMSRGRFSIVATGGSTVLPLYYRLSRLSTDWGAWNIFLSDERCLAHDNPERNSQQIWDAWLAHVPVPTVQIAFMPAELGPEEGAKHYSRIVKENMLFDMVLLSIGADGHVASIFPGATTKRQGNIFGAAVPVRSAPAPWTERVSMSIACLANTHELALIAVGEKKKHALAKIENSLPLPATELAVLPRAKIWADYAAIGKSRSATKGSPSSPDCSSSLHDQDA